MANSS